MLKLNKGKEKEIQVYEKLLHEEKQQKKFDLCLVFYINNLLYGKKF